MESNADVYRQLQRHIDNMPIPFPESESGLDIKVLQHFFTPEEAKVALELSALPEPLERIHKRLKKTGMSLEALEKILERREQVSRDVLEGLGVGLFQEGKFLLILLLRLVLGGGYGLLGGLPSLISFLPFA